MFFIISKVNYQAFIENKQLISIKQLKLEIECYDVLDDYVTGKLNIRGNGYINSLDSVTDITETLTFNIEKSNKDQDLTLNTIDIDNFVYQIVEGRGLELELDFNLEYIKDERSVLKEEIVNNIEEKLDEVFIEENVEEVFIEENVEEVVEELKPERLFSKSRRSYQYYSNEDKITAMSNENGKIFIKRNK